MNKLLTYSSTNTYLKADGYKNVQAMTLSRNRSHVQINKIQFIYDICLKKFMFKKKRKRKRKEKKKN